MIAVDQYDIDSMADEGREDDLYAAEHDRGEHDAEPNDRCWVCQRQADEQEDDDA